MILNNEATAVGFKNYYRENRTNGAAQQAYKNNTSTRIQKLLHLNVNVIAYDRTGIRE